MQIHLVAVLFLQFYVFLHLLAPPNKFSPTHFKCFSNSLTPLIGLVYDRLCALISSRHADASADHSDSYFSSPPLLLFLLFSALFGRPLAATIDLRAELMTKMTNPWGVRVREIMRKMERDREQGSGRPRPTCACAHVHTRTHTHTHASGTCVNTHCAVLPRCSQRWSSAQFCCRGEMPHFIQHRAVICAGVEAPSWHDSGTTAPAVDRCCHPDSAAPATDQTLVVCSSRGAPGTVQRA